MESQISSEKIAKLQNYFAGRPEVAMAFVFGSFAKGRQTAESDVDIAVYFWPSARELEWEENRFFPQEDEIWGAIEKIMGARTDMIVLNRVSSTVAFSAVEEGMPVIIKSRPLYNRFILMISQAAEEFRAHVKEFWEIKQRSRSLIDADKERLIHIADFLEGELNDAKQFLDLDQRAYMSDMNKKRNVERWVENIVNASIDIAKILAASEQKRVPQTYRELLEETAALDGFDNSLAIKLSGFAKLRNILAHEYLDVRFKYIRQFIDEAQPLYRELLAFVKSFIAK